MKVKTIDIIKNCGIKVSNNNVFFKVFLYFVADYFCKN